MYKYTLSFSNGLIKNGTIEACSHEIVVTKALRNAKEICKLESAIAKVEVTLLTVFVKVI